MSRAIVLLRLAMGVHSSNDEQTSSSSIVRPASADPVQMCCLCRSFEEVVAQPLLLAG